ncbi:Histone H2B [Armadillidium vulgare]|nr:Histone H2B [Armadillidium vulgare]
MTSQKMKKVLHILKRRQSETINYNICNIPSLTPKTSGKAAKKAGKAQIFISKGDERKIRRGRRVAAFASTVMKITAKASRLAYYNKRSIIISREIQIAMRLSLSGELTKHAILFYSITFNISELKKR